MELVNSLKSRWSGLQAREQQVLRFGAILLGLVLAYLLIFDPVYSSRSDAEQRLQATREALSIMQGQAADLRAASVMAKSEVTGSLLAQVESSADKFGLRSTLKRLQPSGDDQIQVSLEGASYEHLVQWLRELRDRGVTARRVDIQLDRQSDLLEVHLLLAR